MADHPPDTTNVVLPVNRNVAPHTDSPAEEKIASSAEHQESVLNIESDESTDDLRKKAGIAVIQQQHTIPPTGKRMPTGKWEYIFFCIFCE
jgi:hypothetical protein